MNYVRFFVALSLLIPSFAVPAHADVEDQFLSSLKASGHYACIDTPQRDGYFCRSFDKSTYIVIPRFLKEHTHTVFYAHGLVGVCGNGASGENYLKNESPTLQRIGAIAIMPLRPSASDTSFPLTSFMATVERDLNSAPVPLIMAGHSAAGSFLGVELVSNPKVALRVDQSLLIDAIYGTERVARLWTQALAISPHMTVKLVSSTTAANSREVLRILKEKYPENVSLEIKTEGHCQMPKYFDELQ